jgi:glycogen synthase
VITEAMLCGLPFVASRVGGIPDQAGGFGVLFEQRKPEVLTAAITGALDHYPDHQSRVEAMSNYARRRFTIESMVEQHVALYRSLIGKAARRRSVGLPGMDWLVRTMIARKGQGTSPATAAATSQASA